MSGEIGLPPGWTWATLDELAVSVRNGVSTKPTGTSGTAIFRISAVRPGVLNLNDVRYLQEPYAAYEKFHLRPGDVLFTRYNGNANLVGSAALVPCDVGEVVYPDKLIRVRLDQGAVKPGFLTAAVRTGESREHIREHSKTAAGQVGISGRDLKTTPIPIPPLNEQRRIVSKIETLQTHSRRARKALDAIPALLGRFRQSVLAAAFRGDLTADWRAKNPSVESASLLLERIRVERRERWVEAEAEKARARAEARARKAGTPWGSGDDEKVLARELLKAAKKYKEPEPVDPEKEGLPELPEGWCWASVLALTMSVADGVHKKPEYLDSGVPFVTVKNLTAGPGISFDSLNYISESDHLEFIKRTHPERGDVLITKDGTLGVVRLIDTDVVFSIFVSVAVLKPVERGFGPHLAFAPQTPQVQRMLVATGSGLKHIHLTDLRATPIPVPPVAEQAAIREAVEERLQRIDALAGAASDWPALLNSLDQSILAKAFRGELVPQDPNDEPASVLLERIKAEREALAVKKPKRGRRSTRAEQR